MDNRMAELSVKVKDHLKNEDSYFTKRKIK